MTHLLITVFFGPNDTHCFTITHTTLWSDLCALIAQRTDLAITSLYHSDLYDITLISNDAEWNTLKKHCNTTHINLTADPTFTDTTRARHPVRIQQNLNPYNNQTPLSFTSQFKRFGKFMDRYSDLIQRDEHVRRMMQQTASDLTDQSVAIDWTDLETQLEIKQDELGSKVTFTRHRSAPPSWHPPSSTHLARRSTLNSLVDSFSDIPSPQSGSIWGAYPAYSALHPPPPSSPLDSQQMSPTSLYPLPPPVTPTRSSSSSSSTNDEKSAPIRKSRLFDQSTRLAQQTQTNDPFLEHYLYMEHHKALKKGQEPEEKDMRSLKQQQQEQEENEQHWSTTLDEDPATILLRKSTSLSSLSTSSSSNVSSCALSDLDLLNQDYMATSPLKYPSIPSFSSSSVQPNVKKR